jgi:hypothetical protein
LEEKKRKLIAVVEFNPDAMTLNDLNQMEGYSAKIWREDMRNRLNQEIL